MKALLVSILIFASAATAQAQASGSIQTATVAAGDTFDFTAMSNCMGCVMFGDLTAERGFPYGPSGFAQYIRFYYSEFGFENVTLSSPFVQVAVQVDQNGNASIPAVVLGNWPSGRRYFFRAGVLDDRGRVIFFTPNRSVDPYRHSIVVQ